MMAMACVRKFRFTRPLFHLQWRYYSLQTKSERPTFGIAFDIDGVMLRGRNVIGGATQALRRLFKDPSNPSGGLRESERAIELSNLLGVYIKSCQVLQGHTPFRKLVNRFGDELVLAVGKGEPANVMSEYGFRKVVSMDEYASSFVNIDPLAQYKSCANQLSSHNKDLLSQLEGDVDITNTHVHAAFVVSDPIDWGRDIQVLCDVLRSGGLPGKSGGHQPPLFFAADDLEYQAAFPTVRLGMGAFRIALESIFNRIHHSALTYTSFGKPNATVFKDAEIVLQKISSSIGSETTDHPKISNAENFPTHEIKSLYMIGDNPPVDIFGARQAGLPWFSILTRTGCFSGEGNHADFPADLVVDTVEDAIDYILKKHSKEYL
ncbi:uncharacterized protein YKR070W isoform X2 [Cryptomeria japonica]|uniref:uncharacterized protein YKR070W isoform X2 n=1 Tax=Cryptomeria japonica TaxID=3369 RepID=UPI0027DA7FE9|nr:uncharacterized protein YKR070W isoform X2 [Cryptomeria japonica]